MQTLTTTNKHLGRQHRNCGRSVLTAAEIISHYRRQGYSKNQTSNIPFATLFANMTDAEIAAAAFTDQERQAYLAGDELAGREAK